MKTKSLIALLIGCVFLLSIISMTAPAVLQSMEYEREYPGGDSTGDDSEANIITIRARNPGERSYLHLEYFFGNNTIILIQENIKSCEIWFRRAINREGGGDLDRFYDIMTGPLYLKVYGSGGQKNLTIHELTKTPEKVFKDGNEIPFEMDGNTLHLQVNPTGNYTIIFQSDINFGPGLFDDPEEKINLCYWTIAIFIVIIIISIIFRLFRGGG